MTIGEILQNCELSPLDAELLLSLAIAKPREYLFSHPEHKLATAQIKEFNSFCGRRLKGEPISYISGKKEFFSLEFQVDKNVLIPRPETELLVESSLQALLTTNYSLPTTLIDLGTGSGNIIISLFKNLPKKIRSRMTFFGMDLSKKALSIAKINAQKHKVSKNIRFIQSDLLEYFLKNRIVSKNLFILANLPYVSPVIYKKNINNLKHEPKKALVSPKNGLSHYHRLFQQLRQMAVSCYVLRVTCYVEISPEQKNEIRKIAKKELPQFNASFFKDLAGKTRIVKLTFACLPAGRQFVDWPASNDVATSGRHKIRRLASYFQQD